MTRAKRRFKKNTIKRKRSTYDNAGSYDIKRPKTSPHNAAMRGVYHLKSREEEVALGIVARTPCMCSCIGCGNQRRYYGASLSDKRRASVFSIDHYRRSFDCSVNVMKQISNELSEY